MVKLRKLLLSLFACVIAAPVGTFVATYPLCAMLIVAPKSLQDRLADGWDGTLQLAPTLSVIAFSAMAVIGLPMQFAMQKRGETEWSAHLAPAVLGGAAISALTIIGILYVPFAMLNGFITVSIFWLIRRPDKDEDEKVVT